MFRFALALIALTASPVMACDGLETHDAYAIRATPMAPTAAAFMMIHNTGIADCHLASVRSEIAARTELHTHIAGDNGVMRMVHVTDGFDLPAGGVLELTRGGHHVMFMGLNGSLEQDQVFDLTLVFADGTEAVVPVTVDLTRLGGDHSTGHDAGHTTGHGSGHGGTHGN